MRPTHTVCYSNSSLAIVTVTSTCRPKLTRKNENLAEEWIYIIWWKGITRYIGVVEYLQSETFEKMKTKKQCTEEIFLNDIRSNQKKHRFIDCPRKTNPNQIIIIYSKLRPQAIPLCGLIANECFTSKSEMLVVLTPSAVKDFYCSFQTSVLSPGSFHGAIRNRLLPVWSLVPNTFLKISFLNQADSEV